MSKQRRGRGPEHTPDQGVEGTGPAHHERDADVAASEALGNAAFQAGMGRETSWGESDLLAALTGSDLGGELGGKVAAGLRSTPREPAEHARMLEILEGSDLERRQELIERLESMQAGALAVDDAVREHLGEVSEAERSAWADAYAAAQGAEQATVVEAVHEARGPASPGVAVLTALTAAILAKASWLEEEEEPVGVDYGTEESGM